MIYSKQFVLDQFSTMAVYDKIRSHFKNEIKFLFESASNSGGNYSFITVGVKERIIQKDNETIYINKEKRTKINQSTFDFLKDYYKKINKDLYIKESEKLNIDIMDGFIGYIGYEAIKIFEPKLKENINRLKDELKIPEIDLIRPKLIIAYSHKDNTVSFISPLKNIADKFDFLEKLLKSPYKFKSLKKINKISKIKFSISKKSFFKKVQKAKKLIKKGEIFQILLSNRCTLKSKIDSFSFYRILRIKNPSPYMFFMEYENFSLVGSSPESMVKLQNDKINLNPIAGTRKRGKTKIQDKNLEEELINDPKEKAEHLMLIDLARNDLSKVSVKGSIKVQNLMHIEKFSHVMHLVSNINSKLSKKYDMFDLFKATFTAGTMTGTPKIRAMQLITKLENIKRNFYSGAIAYFSFNGNMDSAITIRTAFISKNKVIFQAGAGIVYDSKKDLEYLEINNKLKVLINSLKELKKQSIN